MLGGNAMSMLNDIRNIPKIESGRDPVQHNVGGTEPGLPMVGVLTQPFRRCLSSIQQLTAGRPIVAASSSDSRPQQKHPKEAKGGRIVPIHPVAQPFRRRFTQVHRIVETTIGEQSVRTGAGR
jgi:hypothetical protein